MSNCFFSCNMSDGAVQSSPINVVTSTYTSATTICIPDNEHEQDKANVKKGEFVSISIFFSQPGTARKWTES